MTIALDYSLIELGISGLLKKGIYERIEDGRITGIDIFIGAIVTRFGETFPDIDLCGEKEGIFGQVIGLNTSKHLLPENGSWFNDYNNPFEDDLWVRIGILKPQSIYLVLSETDTTIVVGDKLKVVDGVVAVAGEAVASVPDQHQFIAEEAKTGASLVRKYFYARFIKA